MQATAIAIASSGKKSDSSDNAFNFSNDVTESKKKRERRRQKMTEILEEIQKEKISAQVPEFVGYINRRRSSIALRGSTLGRNDYSLDPNDFGVSTSGTEFGLSLNRAKSHKFRNNSLLVLQSIPRRF